MTETLSVRRRRSALTRTVLSLVFFACLALGVGFLLSGDDQTFDRRLAGGLFGLAVIGEAARFRIRRSRARRRQSSGS